MTPTIHLLLVLSMHGPAAHVDLAVGAEADRVVLVAGGDEHERAVFAEEVEDSEDDQVESACGDVLTYSVLDVADDHAFDDVPPPARGDAVATHSARGPPAA